MPPVVLERPKMSRPMWDALKTHIMSERHRKKQELEADAEVERQRKERERQQKQHVLTLSETREQITQSEAKLAELKEEKHQLFLQLKKVLHEDETRKRMLQESEMLQRIQFSPAYGNPPRIQMMDQGPPYPSHSQNYLQPIQLSRTPVTSHGAHAAQVFKIGGGGHGGPPPSHHTTSPHSSMPITIKRARSPSPPSQHNYKFGPFKPPPQAIPQYGHSQHGKPTLGLQYFHQPGQSQNNPNPSPSPGQQHTSHGAVTFSPHPPGGGGGQSGMFSYSSSAPPSRSPQQPTREEPQRHVSAAPMFVHQHAPLPRGYVIHQAAEPHSRSSPHKFPEDGPKYYPPPNHGLQLRPPPHLSIHPGLTIQSNQIKPGVPSGGITSGYPIRTQPSSSAYQGRPPSPQVQHKVAYSVPGGPPRVTYGHPGQMPQQHSIQRYSLPPGVPRD